MTWTREGLPGRTQHIYPTIETGLHGGAECPCGPTLSLLCPECEGVGGDCWRCEDGVVPLGSPLDDPEIVLHRPFFPPRALP